ncbi:hypothetical protein PT974_07795 [Cladobotryum mycophilum]|uniref:Uncharacterized protein n=1 Tax=Cladobotryum mycophilum TaxID=491253 RepID=A0ABR0SJ69_9HYPO
MSTKKAPVEIPSDDDSDCFIHKVVPSPAKGRAKKTATSQGKRPSVPEIQVKMTKEIKTRGRKPGANQNRTMAKPPARVNQKGRLHVPNSNSKPLRRPSIVPERRRAPVSTRATGATPLHLASNPVCIDLTNRSPSPEEVTGEETPAAPFVKCEAVKLHENNPGPSQETLPVGLTSPASSCTVREDISPSRGCIERWIVSTTETKEKSICSPQELDLAFDEAPGHEIFRAKQEAVALQNLLSIPQHDDQAAEHNTYQATEQPELSNKRSATAEIAVAGKKRRLNETPEKATPAVGPSLRPYINVNAFAALPGPLFTSKKKPIEHGLPEFLEQLEKSKAVPKRKNGGERLESPKVPGPYLATSINLAGKTKVELAEISPILTDSTVTEEAKPKPTVAKRATATRKDLLRTCLPHPAARSWRCWAKDETKRQISLALKAVTKTKFASGKRPELIKGDRQGARKQK